ncbi:hypothetical protein KP509_16G008100 [Ceratopteris richardii]|uniref:Uncharacterized protein n=1 Tax=Ceratopteris richardii TaxID=49495 RepID=A0A8T2SWH2_CERRI|nr:hypothetical protein KP509_16G008100 [Ceratopteris richardii]
MEIGESYQTAIGSVKSELESLHLLSILLDISQQLHHFSRIFQAKSMLKYTRLQEEFSLHQCSIDVYVNSYANFDSLNTVITSPVYNITFLYNGLEFDSFADSKLLCVLLQEGFSPHRSSIDVHIFIHKF